MAAERAAELSEKLVLVVPTRSQQAGLTAAVALDPAATPTANAAAMDEAIVELRIGSVAPAARDDVHGRFAVGDAVGFVDDEIIAWGEPEATLGSRPALARPRRRARHLHHAATARRSTTTRSRRWRPTASSSRSRDGGQPATGGCSPPSSDRARPGGAVHHSWRAARRSFASADALPDDAPCAAPRARRGSRSRCVAPHPGRGGARALGLHTVGDCCSTFPRDRRRRARSPSSRSTRPPRVARRGALDHLPPGPPARDEAARRGDRRRRDRRDEGDVLQPAVARAARTGRARG